MTKDNQDALRCAEFLKSAVCEYPQMSEDEPGGYCSEIDQEMDCAAAHLRRLVRENEAKNALLRQAVEALDDLSTYESRPSSIWRYFYPSATGDYVNLREVKEKVDPAIAAIRQHLEGRA